jgi:TolB-like protein
MLGDPGVPPCKEPTDTSPKPAARPSIAVLPFENLGGDPGRDYLADGITEDIITELARLRWLLVIARNSTFSYK